MSADVINLRQARKRKQRAERDRQAEDNRIAFGRTKTEKSLTRATRELEISRIDAHKRESTDGQPSREDADLAQGPSGATD